MSELWHSGDTPGLLFAFLDVQNVRVVRTAVVMSSEDRKKLFENQEQLSWVRMWIFNGIEIESALSISKSQRVDHNTRRNNIECEIDCCSINLFGLC